MSGIDNCERCRELEARGVAVLVCGGCYEHRRGVRPSHRFDVYRATARVLCKQQATEEPSYEAST